MSDFQPAHFSSLIPDHFTPLQKAIAGCYIQHSCAARIGAGPRLGDNTSNDDPTPDCRICGLSLAGELTLRHVVNSQISNVNDQLNRACQRTFHLDCFVEWAEGNIRHRSTVTCPQDRQILIPFEVSDRLRAQYEVPEPTPDHQIRDIDNVVKWWDALNPNPDIESEWGAISLQMNPTDMLDWAAMGSDVGFVTADVLALLEGNGRMGRSLRRRFHRYYDQLKLKRKDGKFPGRVYQKWIYLESDRYLVPGRHEDGVEAATYVWVPMTDPAFEVFRRYLLGLMGEAYAIDVDAAGRVRVTRDRLRPHEVVSVHAEKEIRQLMKLARNRIDPPETVIWYWPFDHAGIYDRGISVGGALPSINYPPVSYNLRQINIGHSNDRRFQDLLADPVAGPLARQNNDEIVNRFRRGELPSRFPQRSDLNGLRVRVPMYCEHADGESRIVGLDLADIEAMNIERTDPATLPPLFPMHTGLNDPQIPTISRFVPHAPTIIPIPPPPVLPGPQSQIPVPQARVLIVPVAQQPAVPPQPVFPQQPAMPQQPAAPVPPPTVVPQQPAMPQQPAAPVPPPTVVPQPPVAPVPPPTVVSVAQPANVANNGNDGIVNDNTIEDEEMYD